jgi:hypothetical protein
MRSFVVSIMVFGFVVACGSSSSPTAVSAGNYNQKCTQNTDCVGIYQGDVCSGCTCINAAIAQSDYNRYLSDKHTALGQCTGGTPCGGCANQAAFCNKGTCGVE